MRISLSTGTFYHRTPRYSLDLARDAGFDGVELVLGGSYVLRGVGPYLDALRASDVPVLSLHPPFYPLPGWPRAAVDRLPRLTLAAEALGAELAVSHVPSVSSETSPRAERFSRAIQLGQDAVAGALPISLETTQYDKRANRYALDDLATLLRYAQERDCTVTFDTCHAGANGQDILACYEILRPALDNVHLSDVRWRGGKPQTHVLPGEGDLQLDRLLARLAADGYTGLVTLEIHPREVGLFGRERHLRRLRQAVDFVRSAARTAASPA